MSQLSTTRLPHAVIDESAYVLAPAAAPTATGLPVGPAPVSVAARWAGRVLSGVPALFLLLDAGMKLAKPAFVVEGTVSLGYPADVIAGLGVVLLAATLLYLVPRTAVLGAILLTGYLGGAVATHVRVWNPLFSHTLFPVYVGAMLWAGLWLRDPRVRVLLPLGRGTSPRT
jgi:hypothetical protein